MSDEYVNFSKSVNLPQQRERISIGKKSIEISNESGIIKERSSKPITQITDTAISRVEKIDVFGLSEEQNLFIQQQHKELLQFAKSKNDSKEVAYIFNKNLNRRYDFRGSDEKLVLGNALIGKGNELFLMHNHPRNGSYSDTDISLFLSSNTVKYFSVVKNNGEVEILTKTDEYNKDYLIIDFKRMYKKYVKNNMDSEISKAIKMFLNRNKEMIQWKTNK